MSDATRRLAVVSGSDLAVAFATVHDAVWAVTIVDAALVRYHSDLYDRVLGGASAADRRLVEESLAGLRFLRNRIRDEAAVSHFVEAGAGHAAGQAEVMGWTWKLVAAPSLIGRRPRARAWELARYRAYQAQLAGHSVGEVFVRAEAFLHRTADAAKAVADIGA